MPHAALAAKQLPPGIVIQMALEPWEGKPLFSECKAIFMRCQI